MSHLKKGLKVFITENSIDVIQYNESEPGSAQNYFEKADDLTSGDSGDAASIDLAEKCESSELLDYCTLDDIDEQNDTMAKAKYIKYMDSVVQKIKNMKWGQTLTIASDPTNITRFKKYCNVVKNIRFSTYIFSGYGSKNILRYFMNKTKDDPDFGYQKIIQILNHNSYRRFLPIVSWKDFWDQYKDEPIKDRHVFELIRSDQPCKPYLDIEWHMDKKSNDARKADYTEFVGKLQKDLITIFKNRYKIKINENSIMIATSHSVDKASFHVVINKLINGKTIVYRTNLKHYPESAWDLWVALVEHDTKYNDVLDKTVYTTDREFRAIFSNKTTELRPFIPYEPYGTKIKKITRRSKVKQDTNTCLRYTVTHSLSDEYYYIATPEPPDKYHTVNKKYCFDGSYVPQNYTDKKINYLLNLVRSVHRTAEYTGRSSCGTGWRFSYADKNEMCYTGNKHVSNGFYVFEDTVKGIIYMKCMSENCKGIHVVERTIKPIPVKKLF
jgi:hypothetical protein